MTRGPVLLSIAVLAASSMMLPAALGHHDDGCDDTYITSCSGSWQVTETADFGWWDGPTSETHSDDPVWIYLEPTGSVADPFEIHAAVSGAAKGSLDVWEVRESEGSASDRVTPRCPQSFASDLLSAGGDEATGSVSHASRVTRLVHDHHQLLIPQTAEDAPDQAELNLELPGHHAWVVVFDASSSLDLGDDQGEIFYQIAADGGLFHADTMPVPDEPLDREKWRDNGEGCIVSSGNDPGEIEGSSAHAAGGPSMPCDLSDRYSQIHVSSATEDQSSFSEYVYFFDHFDPVRGIHDSTDRGLEKLQALLGTGDDGTFDLEALDQNADAEVVDLGCSLISGAYSLDIDQGPSEATVLLRFYDHFGIQLAETDCSQGNLGAVPDYTQFVATVACEGTPQNTDGFVPYTVETHLQVQD